MFIAHILQTFKCYNIDSLFYFYFIFEGPIPDCVAKEPNEDRLKGSQSSLPSYNEATSGIFSQGQGDKTSLRPGNKKKIIPVQSDFESSSPSPEPPPAPSPPAAPKLSMRVSQSSVNLARAQQDTAEVGASNRVWSSNIYLKCCIPEPRQEQETSWDEIEDKLQ